VTLKEQMQALSAQLAQDRAQRVVEAELLQRIATTIYGKNGDEKAPGILMDVDRLKQVHRKCPTAQGKRFINWGAVASGTITGLLVAVITFFAVRELREAYAPPQNPPQVSAREPGK